MVPLHMSGSDLWSGSITIKKKREQQIKIILDGSKYYFVKRIEI